MLVDADRKAKSFETKANINKIIETPIMDVGYLVSKSLLILKDLYKIQEISLDAPMPSQCKDNLFLCEGTKLGHCSLDGEDLFIQSDLKFNFLEYVNEISITFIYNFKTSKKLTYKYEDMVALGHNDLQAKIIVDLSDELYNLRYGGSKDEEL